jgi:hypothetical protein
VGGLLDVVAGALEQDGAVVGEDLLPASPLGVTEGDVLRRPDEQRRPVGKRWQAALDLGQEWPLPSST